MSGSSTRSTRQSRPEIVEADAVLDGVGDWLASINGRNVEAMVEIQRRFRTELGVSICLTEKKCNDVKA